MKFLLAAFILIFTFPSLAGGYYSPDIDVYDPDTGLYYKSVLGESSSGFLSNGPQPIVNLYIYKPESAEAKYLFPKPSKLKIVGLVFETDIVDGQVHFYNQFSPMAKNNQGLAARQIKNKLLIITRDEESKQDSFYFAAKDGSGLKKIKTIASTDSWHIDAKNSVIRVVRQLGSEISIENIPW